MSPILCLVKECAPKSDTSAYHHFSPPLMRTKSDNWLLSGELCSIILVKGEHHAPQTSLLRLMELTCSSPVKCSMSSLSVPFTSLLQLNPGSPLGHCFPAALLTSSCLFPSLISLLSLSLSSGLFVPFPEPFLPFFLKNLLKISNLLDYVTHYS